MTDWDEYFDVGLFDKFLFKIYDMFGLTSNLASTDSYNFSSDYEEIETDPD